MIKRYFKIRCALTQTKFSFEIRMKLQIDVQKGDLRKSCLPYSVSIELLGFFCYQKRSAYVRMRWFEALPDSSVGS